MIKVYNQAVMKAIALLTHLHAQKTLLLLAAVAIGAGVYLGFFSSFGDRALSVLSPQTKLEQQFFACFEKTDRNKALNCIAEKSPAWIKKFGAKKTGHLPDVYRAAIGDDFTCHLSAHLIGEDIYAVSEDLPSSMQACTQSCSAGCIHGTTVGYVAEYGTEKFLASDFNAICSGKNDTATFGEKTRCFHGIGHALMAGFEGNVEESLAACNRIRVPDDYRRFQCFTGVFMELFSASQGLSHLTIPSLAYVKTGDPLYPCTSSFVANNKNYEAACLLQLGVLLPSRAVAEQQAIFDICNESSSEGRKWCYTGIGLSIISATSENSDRLISTCTNAPEMGDQIACLSGGVGFLKLDTDSRAVYKKTCNEIPANLREYACPIN